MLKLGVIDQSPVSEGMTNKQAIDNTIELAKITDRLGFSRYWVSEHHGSRSFASASPEILITNLAANTQKIRVGTAGILMSHYDPFKIAEQINLLCALYPDRIDLGVGRALGGDPNIVKLLNSNPSVVFDRYSELIEIIYNNNSVIRAVPETEYKPEFWVLGSSPSSAKFAAERGLRYSFAAFINALKLSESLQVYHQYFTPSEFLEKPYVNLSIFALCSEETEQAEKLAKVAEEWLINSLVLKKDIPFPKERSVNSPLDLPQAQMLLNVFRKFSAIGNSKEVIKKLINLKNQYLIDEFTLATITYDNRDKINSYKLIMEENRKGNND